MANHAAELLLTAQLNYTVSLREINKQITALGKDPKLKKLQLKVEVEKGLSASLKKFSEAVGGLTEAFNKTQQVSQTTKTRIKEVDGTIKETTQTVQGYGKAMEVITRESQRQGKATKAQTDTIKNQNKEMGNNVQTLKTLKNELKNYNKVRTDVNRNDRGQVSSLTHTYAQKDTGKQLTINTDSNGVLNNSKATTDYIKAQKALQDADNAYVKNYNETMKTRKAIADKALADEKAKNSEYERVRAEEDKIRKAITNKTINDAKTRESALQEEASIRKAIANNNLKQEEKRYNDFSAQKKQEFDAQVKANKAVEQNAAETAKVRKAIADKNLADENKRTASFTAQARVQYDKYVAQQAEEKRINDLRAANAKARIEQERAINKGLSEIQAKRVVEEKQHYQALQENQKINQQRANLSQNNTDRGARLAAQYANNPKLMEQLAPLNVSPIGNSSQRNTMAKSLNEELKTFEQYAKKYTAIQNKLTSAQNKFKNNNQVTAGLRGLQTELNGLAGNSSQRINAIAGLNEQFKQLTTGVDAGRRSMRLFEDGMIGAIGNMIKFQIALSAIYVPLQALGDMINTVFDLDAQMTQMKRVMDDANDFKQIQEDNIAIANEMGRSIQDVNENSIGFARMGFDSAQTESLAKTATLLQNISDLKANEAIDTLTTAMTVFNVTANNSIDIANKLNEVDNNFAVTTQDLAQSISRAGSTAATFGEQNAA